MNKIILTFTLLVSFLASAGDFDQFKKTRFVDKDQINAPTGMAVSPEGVVYISSDPNGARSGLEGVGKVYRCEDSTGDGVADKVSVYLDKINSPRGLCYVGNTLYLMHPPFLSAIKDNDGDGKVDEQTVLLKNLGRGLITKRVDHAQNGVRLAIDGWLYMAIGDQGCFNTTGTDGSQVSLHGGGVLRVRPDGSKLEIVATGTRNIYNLAIDPYLDIFTRDNTNDGGGWNTRFHQIFQYADYGYPRLYKNFGNEAMKSLVDYGGGSGTGMYYIHEPGFPGNMGDMLVSNDYGRGILLHERKKQGASYQIKQQNLPFKRPMSTDVDGFSRLYISSWDNGGASFSKNQFGYVERYVYEEGQAARFPNLKKANEKELLKHLISRSQVTRINSMCEILERASSETLTQGLKAFVANKELELYARVAALFCYKQLEGAKANPLLVEIAQDKTIREFAIRSLGDFSDQVTNVPQELIFEALKDDDKRVQSQALSAFGKMHLFEHAAKLFPLASSEKMIVDNKRKSVSLVGSDGSYTAPIEVLPHVALKVLVELKNTKLYLDLLKDKKYRETALRILQHYHDKSVVDALIQNLEKSQDKELNELIMMALFRLYHREVEWKGMSWWNTRPNHKGPYYQPTKWAMTESIKLAIEKGYNQFDKQTINRLIATMRLNQIFPSDLNLEIKFDSLVDLLEKDKLSPEQSVIIMDAVERNQITSGVKVKIFHKLSDFQGVDLFATQVKLLNLWKASKAKEADLRRLHEDFIITTDYLSDFKSLENKIKNHRSESYYACLIMLNMKNNPVVPAEVKSQINNTISKLAKDKKLSGRLLGPALLTFSKISNLINEDQYAEIMTCDDKRFQKLKPQFKKLYSQKTSPSSALLAAMAYDDIMAAVKSNTGKASQGHKFFTSQACFVCHTTNESEAPKGPYLGTVGEKFSREFIAESILRPSAIMAQGFVTKWFKMKDGTTIEGFVTGFDGPAFEVRNVSGMTQKVDKSKILESGDRDTSMMPEGLVNNMSLDDFNALLDYLQSLK